MHPPRLSRGGLIVYGRKVCAEMCIYICTCNSDFQAYLEVNKIGMIYLLDFFKMLWSGEII